MKINMGLPDRAIRILAAVAIGVLYFVNLITGSVAIVLLVIAGAFIVSGFIGFCPMYYPLKISTCKKKQQKA